MITTENACILLSPAVQPVSGRCVFMEMKQIELELAYVGYVKKKKITDGAHVIKLCKGNESAAFL